MTFTLTYSTLIDSTKSYTQNTSSTVNPNFIAAIPQFIFNAEVRISRDLKALEGKRVANSVFVEGQAIYQKPNRWRETISISFAKAPTIYPTVSRQNTSGDRIITTSLAMRFEAGSNVNVYNVGGAGYNGNFTLSDASQFTIEYSSGSGTEALTSDTDGFVSIPPQNYTLLRPRSSEYCREYWPDLTEKDYPLYYGDFDFNNIIIVPTPLATLPWQLNYYETPEHLSDTNDTNWITDQAPDMLLYATLVEAFNFLKNYDQAAAWEQKYTQSGQSRGMEARARIDDATDNREDGT